MSDSTATEPRVIWELGDRWRDLQPELDNSDEPITIVSSHGTARVLSPQGWQLRIPLEGGHRMRLDQVRQPLLRVISATPCGVHTATSGGRSHMTTPLILVLAGEHPNWLRTGLGRRALEASFAGDWGVEGHPDAPCGAAYCIVEHPDH